MCPRTHRQRVADLARDRLRDRQLRAHTTVPQSLVFPMKTHRRGTTSVSTFSL